MAGYVWARLNARGEYWSFFLCPVGYEACEPGVCGLWVGCESIGGGGYVESGVWMELLFSGKFSAERRQNLGFADRGRKLNLRQEGLEDRLIDATARI